MKHDKIGELMDAARDNLSKIEVTIQNRPITYDYQREVNAVYINLVKALRQQLDIIVLIEHEIATSDN